MSPRNRRRSPPTTPYMAVIPAPPPSAAPPPLPPPGITYPPSAYANSFQYPAMNAQNCNVTINVFNCAHGQSSTCGNCGHLNTAHPPNYAYPAPPNAYSTAATAAVTGGWPAPYRRPLHTVGDAHVRFAGGVTQPVFGYGGGPAFNMAASLQTPAPPAGLAAQYYTAPGYAEYAAAAHGSSAASDTSSSSSSSSSSDSAQDKKKHKKQKEKAGRKGSGSSKKSVRIDIVTQHGKPFSTRYSSSLGKTSGGSRKKPDVASSARDNTAADTNANANAGWDATAAGSADANSGWDATADAKPTTTTTAVAGGWNQADAEQKAQQADAANDNSGWGNTAAAATDDNDAEWDASAGNGGEGAADKAW